MSDYDDIPDWIKTVTPLETEDSLEKIVTELNYLKGAFIGHTLRGLEDDEKLALAFKYQRERDALFLEGLTQGIHPSDMRTTNRLEAFRDAARMLREQG